MAKQQPDPQATTNPPDAQNGAATAVLDPPPNELPPTGPNEAGDYAAIHSPDGIPTADEVLAKADAGELPANSITPSWGHISPPTIDGFAAWCKEDVVYLFDPDTRELMGANIRLSSDDGQTGDTYEATIRRDGSGDAWAWHEGKRFMGTHAPDPLTLVTRSLTRGRGLVLSAYVT